MADQDIDPLTVTIPTACQVSGLGRTTLYFLLTSGKIKSTTIGTRRLVDYASLKTLLTGKGG